ncbi:hypothetical protein ACQCT6_14585 [Cytobacillus gottheilii]|nr:hypothetical protein [Cytobacillus gottheilii]
MGTAIFSPSFISGSFETYSPLEASKTAASLLDTEVPYMNMEQ